MSWKAWRDHFERNAERPLPPMAADGQLGSHAPDRVRPIAQALARFQAGESGEGRLMKEIDGVFWNGIDDDYRACVKLFVKEEGRHARILASMVRSLGGRIHHRTRSQRLFTTARRLIGVRTKLLFLLAAEVVGIGFYRTLADALPDGGMKQALVQIAGDEAAHLGFHTAFFQTQTGTAPRRALFRAIWPVVAGGACVLVLAVERDTLAAIGVPKRNLARCYLTLLQEVDHAVAHRTRQPAPERGQRSPSRLRSLRAA